MARLFVPRAEIEEGLRDYFRSFNLVVSYLFDPDGILRGNLEAMGVKTYLEASHQVEPGRGHAAAQLARPLERLAMFLEDPAPRLEFAGREGLAAGSGTLLAIHPGSGALRKNWPVENWCRLGPEVVREFPGLRLALVTGEAEAERGITSRMVEAWRGLEFEHWDQLPLPEVAVRFGSAAGFLGHDSGMSHLAAACGRPCLLFFGPTDPAVWAPRNEGVEVHLEPSGDLGRLGFATAWAAVRRFAAGLGEKNPASRL